MIVALGIIAETSYEYHSVANHRQLGCFSLFVHANIKENIEVTYYGPFPREIIGNGGFPLQRSSQAEIVSVPLLCHETSAKASATTI